MTRWIFLTYGVACHVLFLVTFACLAGFVGNFVLPNTLDSPSTTSPGLAVAIDLALLAAFAAQHSIMARPAFKRVWTRIIPQPIERSTYVLAASIVSGLLIWQWRGIPTIVWSVESPLAKAVMWGLFAFGWLLVPLVSLMISHFDLFGTRQVWLHFQGRELASLPFGTPWLYKAVRHPLYIGWTIAFWATPMMTVSHLLFAAGMTIYMGLAAIVEEHDLVTHFGRAYADYQRRVPMFVPRLRQRPESADFSANDTTARTVAKAHD